MDSAGVADGDHLADPGVPGDRGREPADGGVVFGLADQPGQLAGERLILGGERGQDLGQRADRLGILRPSGDLVEDRLHIVVGGGSLNQPRQSSPALPGAGDDLVALIDRAGGQEACRGQRGRFGPLHDQFPA